MSILYHFWHTLVLYTLSQHICDGLLDPRSTFVWGPGLKAKAVLPARYFFIHAVDTEGMNVTDSLGDKAFAVNIYQKNGERLRVWTQVMDRNDGSYVVRYRLFSASEDLMIDVLHNGRHVAKSPYTLSGPVYHEKCYCPQPNLNQWLKELECPQNYRQIKLDLSLFKKVDMELVEKEAVQRFNQRGRHSLCHYVVNDNKIFRNTYGELVGFKKFMDRTLLSMARKIYRKTYGQHVDFKMFMDSVLLSMTRKMVLPDMEFFVNLGDWPLENKKTNENPLPIFSWCGSDDTKDIVMPTYDMTESTLETMGRVTLDMISVQGNTGPRWENKSDLAFFRGRDSRQERLDLVKLSRKHPDVIDAKLTNMFFFKHEEDLGELVKHSSFFDFFKHKYQINIDGTVAAYRLPYLLAGDALVFKQDSQYYEFFYKQLKPYVHYVPIKADLSDLLKQIQWAKDHQEEAKKIAQNAQQFARDNLLGQDVFCYHAVLFKEYAKRLVKAPYVRKDMEEVHQPNDIESQCTCHHKQAKTKSKQKQKKEEL